MPIYEYECPKHGRMEKICLRVSEQKEEIKCDTCGRISPLVPSLVSMQPDDMWHGKYVPGVDKVFNSRSEYNRFMKQSNREKVERAPSVKRKSIAETGAKARREHVVKHLADYAL